MDSPSVNVLTSSKTNNSTATANQTTLNQDSEKVGNETLIATNLPSTNQSLTSPDYRYNKNIPEINKNELHVFFQNYTNLEDDSPINKLKDGHSINDEGSADENKDNAKISDIHPIMNGKEDSMDDIHSLEKRSVAFFNSALDSQQVQAFSETQPKGSENLSEEAVSFMENSLKNTQGYSKIPLDRTVVKSLPMSIIDSFDSVEDHSTFVDMRTYEDYSHQSTPEGTIIEKNPVLNWFKDENTEQLIANTLAKHSDDNMYNGNSDISHYDIDIDAEEVMSSKMKTLDEINEIKDYVYEEKENVRFMRKRILRIERLMKVLLILCLEFVMVLTYLVYAN